MRIRSWVTAALTIGLLVPVTEARADTAPGAPEPASAAPHSTSQSITLVTGDVVRVITGPDGRRSVGLEPGPDGRVPEAAITTVHGHTYVVPTQAYGLLSSHRLDRSLFDVTQMVEDGYDDAARASLPVIVDYGQGPSAAREARVASLDAARRTVVVPALGVAAFHAKKSSAQSFWADLTTGSDAQGSPTGLSGGARTVTLDGKVHATADTSVEQIHAPQAWAAGYDGSGATVAVLDTGWDPTHPDLPASLVTAQQNFTGDPSIVDGNGHGTHVASTIAGTGAASGGTYEGVAPGSHLMIGKVLDNTGMGEDSWVLAGMQWAVQQGADVVNMSIGGDPDDGTSMLAQAVNELSASSDTLFVIAAGNAGSAPSTLTSPGAADAALTVGAVDSSDQMAGFSSRGPRLRDGALKPEIVAPGVDVTAARAVGTDLGGDAASDQWYTTISGTSMATPHVAGVAAILKGEHPSWDGEQLKAALINSTVPVAEATAFDAGTGRVDAMQAVDQTVFAPGTLELGNFSWPYKDLSPASKTLTYRNSGASAVTLDLDLAGEDGSAESTGSMTLSTRTLAVPAGGEASVEVTVDPTIAPPGAYSAVVTGSVEGSAETVRTGLAYQLEPERYDVTVTVKPRAGMTNVGHLLGLSGMQDPWVYEQRTFDPSSTTQSVTFRLAPGTYSAGVVSNGLASDGAHVGLVSYQPAFTVAGDTTVVLDENDTRRFGYDVSRPVVNDGSIIDVSWTGTAGTTGFTYYGVADRVYARPSAGLPGRTQAAAQFLLSQPEGLVTPTRGAGVGLRPVVAAGAPVTEAAVPHLDGRYQFVDAGSVSGLRTGKVNGRIALVKGSCGDLSATAARLKAAKAVAMIAYPAAQATCAGTINGKAPLPSLSAPASAVSRLLADPSARLRTVTHKSPQYVYDLAHFYAAAVPAGATVKGTGTSVAAVAETYRGLNSTSAAGLVVLEEPIAWVAARNGVANLLSRREPVLPATVTYYLSTSAKWERSVRIQDSTWYGDYAQVWAPPRAFPGGRTTKDTWFGGPLVLRVSPLASLTNGFPPPTREVCVDPDVCWEPRDEMFLQTLGGFTDSAGHVGQSDLFASDEYSGQLYADGQQLVDMPASVFMSSEVPPGRHRFRLDTRMQRSNPFWGLSSQTTTSWRFVSDSPTAAHPIAALPLLGVDYRMKLSATNSAPAGHYAFHVAFAMPASVKTLPVTEPRVQISWNGGTSWRTVPATCRANTCQIRVTNKKGGHASLRVAATDTHGRSVRQTVLDAYVVG